MIKVFSDKYKSLLKEYYYIGGMPEVVESYVNYKDYNRVRKIQDEILLAYEKDFSKHVPEQDLPKVIQIWNNFNTQLARENKKFIYGALKPSARASEYKNAINWLVDSGLMYKINRVTTCKIPLDGYIDYSAFKLYFLNVPITYWSNNAGQAEVDFVIQCKNEIVPIEVKAEENLQSKSLKVLAEKYKTKYNVRTSMSDYKENDWITNIPLYNISNIEKIIH